MAVRSVAVACTVCLATAAPALGAEGVFAACEVIESLPNRPIVMIRAGRTQGLAIDDRAVLLAGGKMTASGRVFYLEPALSAVRLAGRGSPAAGLDRAIVVSKTMPQVCRVALPRGTTISALMDDVAPGHRSGWLDHGRRAGFLLGDCLMIRRSGTPIARARVVEVYEDQALVTLRRVAPGRSVRPGDHARLWPSPAQQRSGQARLPLLMVEPAGTEQHLWLPGGPEEGLVLDCRVEVLRGGGYVTTAVVDRPGADLTRATTVEAYTREAARVGDDAVLLPRADGTSFSGRIFRIERDYCLVSAGEDVGIRRGQALHVVRQGRSAAKLTVETVKETYCGATIDVRPAKADLGPRLWDQILPRPPEPQAVQRIGKVVGLGPEGRFATVSELGRTVQCEPGTLVSVVRTGHSRAAALIVHKSGSSLILYTPPCWRGGPVAVGSEVFYSLRPDSRE